MVFTNNPEIVNKITVEDGISDHELVIADLNIAPIRTRPVKRKIYLHNKADIDGMKQELEDFAERFKQTSKGKTLSEKWNDIKTAINDTMERFVPHKFTTTRFNLPWFDRSLRQIVKKK